MTRTCLLCGRERRGRGGDYCGPCRIGLKAEAMLEANWRLRALNWFRYYAKAVAS